MVAALRDEPVPALGQPMRRVGVTAGLNERGVLGVGHQARRQLAALQIDGMAGLFVVETKLVASIAKLHGAGNQRMPAQRRRWRVAGSGTGVGRQQRILREQVQDVGQQQLLMLLFMLQAERHDRAQLRVAGMGAQQRLNALVNVAPVLQYLAQRGARQQAATRSRVLVADRVVVGVEQHPKGRMKRQEAAFALLQYKGFKKPGRVGQVPLGRTGIGHRLHAAVFGRQRRHQRGTACAHCVKAGDQVGRHGVVPGVWCHGRARITPNQWRSSLQLCAWLNPAERSKAMN